MPPSSLIAPFVTDHTNRRFQATLQAAYKKKNSK